MIGDLISSFVQPEDFIYGPSCNGCVRHLADFYGCKELNDLDNDECLPIIELSKNIIRNSVNENYKIIFDLTNIDDINNILANKGQYADTITSKELLFIKENYTILQNNVIFIKDEKEVAKPW